MKFRTVLLIILVILALGVIGFFLPSGERVCPEAWIVNRMPTIGGGGGSEYFIVAGDRREKDELDVGWIARNCDVEPQEVF